MKLSFYLQKVILLPRLDMFKNVIFTSRIVILIKPFPSYKKGKYFAKIWHEALSGRTDENNVSAFHAFISGLRDIKSITL